MDQQRRQRPLHTSEARDLLCGRHLRSSCTSSRGWRTLHWPHSHTSEGGRGERQRLCWRSFGRRRFGPGMGHHVLVCSWLTLRFSSSVAEERWSVGNHGKPHGWPLTFRCRGRGDPRISELTACKIQARTCSNRNKIFQPLPDTDVQSRSHAFFRRCAKDLWHRATGCLFLLFTKSFARVGTLIPVRNKFLDL